MIATQHGLSFTHQLAHRLFRGDPRPAWRTPREMLIDEGAIGGRQLAVDIRGDQRLDRGTTRHGRVSSAGACQTTSGVRAKYGTSRCRQEH